MLVNALKPFDLLSTQTVASLKVPAKLNFRINEICLVHLGLG